MTPLEHNRVKNAATHFPISGSVDYMQTTKMKESIQVLRKSKQNLSKSMTKFKQGTLFFLPPPNHHPALKFSRVRQGNSSSQYSPWG